MDATGAVLSWSLAWPSSWRSPEEGMRFTVRVRFDAPSLVPALVGEYFTGGRPAGRDRGTLR